MEYTLCVWPKGDRASGVLPRVVYMEFPSLEYAKGVGRSIVETWGPAFEWDVVTLRNGKIQVVAQMEEAVSGGSTDKEGE